MTMQRPRRWLTPDESREAMGRDPVVRTVINVWTVLVIAAIVIVLWMRYC